MSRIYFHSLHGEAEVRGWERARAGALCSDMLMVALGVSTSDDMPSRPSPIRRILPPNCYALEYSGYQFASWLHTWLVASNDTYFVVNSDRKITVFSAALNTAHVTGSDPVKLLARLHGQCELHAYVEGHNRAWLADIIEQGRAAGIMRADSGWESVIELLRTRDDEPVVTSYSVCEQFPNQGVANWQNDDEVWYELPADEKWRLALAGLRNTTGELEIKPDTWQTYTYRHGVNGFQLRDYAASPASDGNGGHI